MDNKNEETYRYTTKYDSIDYKIDSIDNKLISVDKDDKQISRINDDDNKITTNTNINPFTAALDIWQSYANIWTETSKQLFYRNPFIPNGEFLFIYYRFDSKTKEKLDSNDIN